jgi:hypothetical protein
VAYRQIPIDPGDLHLVGFQWGDKLTDRVLPMGLRSSAQICQRIATAVSFIYYKMGYMVVNYLDDLGGRVVSRQRKLLPMFYRLSLFWGKIGLFGGEQYVLLYLTNFSLA